MNKIYTLNYIPGRQTFKRVLSNDIIFLSWNQATFSRQWMCIINILQKLIQRQRYISWADELTFLQFRSKFVKKHCFRSCFYLYLMIWSGQRRISIWEPRLISIFSWLGMGMVKTLIQLVNITSHLFILFLENEF